MDVLSTPSPPAWKNSALRRDTSARGGGGARRLTDNYGPLLADPFGHEPLVHSLKASAQKSEILTRYFLALARGGKRKLSRPNKGCFAPRLSLPPVAKPTEDCSVFSKKTEFPLAFFCSLCYNLTKVFYAEI